MAQAACARTTPISSSPPPGPWATPARYVSGYLMMNDRVHQDASHAWAEAHVEGVGWVGFDVSNGISPDARYVRVATGLDYREAAPISGLRFGQGGEALSIDIQVQQQ
jgi:transglutaminase-like putative cysteine protease